MKKTIYLSLCTLLCLSIFSCSKNAYKATNKVYTKTAKKYAKEINKLPYSTTGDGSLATDWVGTTNFNMRKPNIVIIHHTAQNSCEQTLKTFTLPRTGVSAHYVICEDGTVHQMLNDYLRAWHAGAGKWGTVVDVNSASIGIEIDNDGVEPFFESQMLALEKILTDLKEKYKIPKANFIGHADIAPTRKNDPNVTFNWERLANKGFGLWYSDTSKISVPENFDIKIALKVIGYDISDLAAASISFKRKFLRKEDGPIFTEEDKKVLYSIFKQSME